MFPVSGENSVECVNGFFMKKIESVQNISFTWEINDKYKVENFRYLLGNLQQSSDIFSNLWKSLPVFGNLR